MPIMIHNGSSEDSPFESVPRALSYNDFMDCDGIGCRYISVHVVSGVGTENRGKQKQQSIYRATDHERVVSSNSHAVFWWW